MDLQLDGITMRKLSVEWIPPEDVEKVRAVGTLRYTFDKDHFNNRKFCLNVSLAYECKNVLEKLEGYQVVVLVDCHFTSTSQVDTDEAGKAAVRDALPIVYGTLRGLLASATGCFEVGLLLPTADIDALLNNGGKSEEG